jgi:hypothetical protein
MAEPTNVPSPRAIPARKPLLALSVTSLLGVVIGFSLNLYLQIHIGPLAAKLHRLLENLYLFAGIMIAPLAAVGLYQLWLTREGIELTRKLAEQGENRDALKLANEQCLYFADKIACETALFDKIKQNPAKFRHLVFELNPNQPGFTISNNLIEIPGFNFQEACKELLELNPVEYMNLLEGFAIPFAANMANDDVGYFETGIPFTHLMQRLMPCFLTLRLLEVGRYIAAVSLYERWQGRYKRERLTIIRDSIDRQIGESRR